MEESPFARFLLTALVSCAITAAGVLALKAVRKTRERRGSSLLSSELSTPEAVAFKALIVIALLA